MRRSYRLLYLICIFFIPVLSLAQSGPPMNQQPGGSMGGPMRHQRPPGGPWEQDVLLYTSHDGTTFQEAGTFEPYAGVPCVIQDAKGRLLAVFQWFPMDDQKAFDHVAVKISTDSGKTWSTPQSIIVSGYPSDLIRPFDPTLVLLEDGKFRIYFSGNQKGPQNRPGIAVPKTYSALSDDGINYIFEEGIRFTVSGKPVVDPALAKLGDTWHYYSPIGPNQGFYHATSKDGLNFKREADITTLGDGIGNVVAYQDGIRFYAGSRRGLWWSFSKNGFDWEKPVMTGIKGGDPGVVWAEKNKLLLIPVSGKVRSIPVLPFDVKL